MTIIMPLSFSKPPLSANQRFGHWAQKAKIVREVRQEVNVRARGMKLGPFERISVQLVYRPRDKRRRDRGNIMPTHKAALDGLVDAGVVPDDNPEFVEEMMPRIDAPVKGEPGCMWLEIVDLSASHDAG